VGRAGWRYHSGVLRSEAVAPKLLFITLLLLGLSACQRTAAVGRAKNPMPSAAVRTPPEPAAKLSQAALVCMLSLSEDYEAGLDQKALLAKAKKSGLPQGVIQPFLDYIGAGKAIAQPTGKSGLSISIGAADDFRAIFARFGDIKGAGFGGALAGLVAGSAEDLRHSAKYLARDLNELLPNTDLSAPPVATPDALLDKYLAEVEARIAAAGGGILSGQKNSSPSSTTERLAALPDSTLALWEGQFGSDPRYWELRYLCAERMFTPKGKKPQTLAQGYSVAEDFLREAVKRGGDPAAAALVLADKALDAGRAEQRKANPNMDWREANKLPTPPLGAEAREQLRQAVVAAPDTAWLHYYLALAHYSNGDAKGGLAELQAGNASKDKAYPYVFPLSEFIHAADPKLPPGSPSVAAAVLELQPTQDHAAEKQIMRGVVAQAQAQGNTEPFDSILEMQTGQLEVDALEENTYGIARLTYMLSFVKEVEQALDGQLKPAQQEALERMRCAGQLAREIQRSRFGRYCDMTNNIVILIGIAGERGSLVSRYLSRLQERQTRLASNAVLLSTKGLRLSEGTLPQALLAYPAVTSDEMKAARSPQPGAAAEGSKDGETAGVEKKAGR